MKMKWSVLALFGISGLLGLLGGKSAIEDHPSASTSGRRDNAIKSDSAVDHLVEGVDVDRFQQEHTLLVATNHVS